MFPGGEDSNGGKQFLVSSVNVFVHNRGIEEVAVKVFDTVGLFGTASIIIILRVCVCLCTCGTSVSIVNVTSHKKTLPSHATE